MVLVTLTDTDYGHALKWDLAVSVIARRGMTVLRDKYTHHESIRRS